MMPDTYIYKILRAAEYEDAMAAPQYVGSADDIRDGFIHFSTLEQLVGTTQKYFRSEKRAVILCFPVDAFSACDLRWEPSRGGALFPHLYGPLDVSKATAHWTYDVPAEGPVNLSFIKDQDNA